MRPSFILLISFFCLSQLIGQVRNYSNEFLAIGIDAAAFGKGNSVVASSDNINAIYWNPAGLSTIENKQVALMHASYFGDVANYDYAAFATPLDAYSSVGIGAVRLGIDGILDTRNLIVDGDNLTPFDELKRFSTADYAFLLSYSRKAFSNERFSYGVSAKVIRRIIGDFAKSWGFGLDVGIQGKSKNGKWKYGAIARDITTTYNSWQIQDGIFDTDDTITREGSEDLLAAQEEVEDTEITLPSIQFGLARDISFSRDFNLNIEANINTRFAQTNDIINNNAFSLSPSLGFELNFQKIAYLRGGVNNFQKEEQFDGSERTAFQPSFGLGFSYRGITIDYAITDIGDQSIGLQSNIFSLIIDWSLFKSVPPAYIRR